MSQRHTESELTLLMASTAYVKVGVTIDGAEHIDYLPIMGHNNQSLSCG